MQRVNHFLIEGLFILIVYMVSCTEATLQDKSIKAEGTLHIHPLWSKYEVVPILQTHLYHGETASLHQETASSEYTLTAESGIYSIISHNANALGVQFTDLDNYHQAKAMAVKIDQTKAESKDLFPSENAFRLAVESIAITPGEDAHIYPPVHSLIKTLVFKFKITNGDKYHKIKGSLNGVYHAVYLATGLPVGNDTGWTIPFETDIKEENRTAVTIHLLGIYDPANGIDYQSVLRVILEDSEGNSYPKDIDLSEAITDILNNNEGDIPIDIPIEVEVELEVANGSLIAIIKPWKKGTGTGEIKPK